MFGAKYFEQVIPDQVRLMERPVRLTLNLTNGDELIVHALVAAHEGYVVLKVHGKGKNPQHSKPWQTANPKDDPAIHDQATVPYSSIALAFLTAKTTIGDERTLTGFERALQG